MRLDGATEDSYSFDDAIVRGFLLVTVFWGLAAAIGVVFLTSTLLHPRLGSGPEWLSFGRLQPVGEWLLLMGFIANGIFAGIYYSTQRLCRAGTWSRFLGWLHLLSWQAIIVAGLVTLPRGITQGRVGGEVEWPIDLAITLVWILFFASTFFMTLVRRRVTRMYASLWFFIAAIVAMALVTLCNLFVFPNGWWKSDSLATGMQDALLQTWYTRNAFLFSCLLPLLGLTYYFVPKVLNQPLHSYKLAIVSFWVLVIAGVWAAPQHLHYTALPEWISSLGMISGVLLGLAILGSVSNILATFRGAEVQKPADPRIRFLKFGTLLLGFYAAEEIFLSVKSIQAQVNYTEWMTAHFYLGSLGCGGMLILGMSYWMIPRLFQTEIASAKAVGLHFWLGAIGVLLCVLPGYAAGVVQAFAWNAMDDLGNLKFDFAESNSFLKMMWSLQMLGGMAYVAGMAVMLVIHARTWLKRARPYAVPVHHVESGKEPNRTVSNPEPASVLEDVPVLNFAKKVDVWTRLSWHRELECAPRKLGIFVVLAVLLAFIIEVVPVFVFPNANAPKIASVRPLTPLELMGRHIYLVEGCANCHTQMVRPLMAETKRYGEFSQPGEFIYDQPAQWGSRRIGPDLARESGKQTSFWHWQHLDNPRHSNPKSSMPSYRYLLDRPIDFSQVDELVQTAKTRGLPYEIDPEDTQKVINEQAERVAADIVSRGGTIRRGKLMTFDTQAVALIAYLQRLGADLTTPISVEKPEADVESGSADSNAASKQAADPRKGEVAVSRKLVGVEP